MNSVASREYNGIQELQVLWVRLYGEKGMIHMGAFAPA